MSRINDQIHSNATAKRNQARNACLVLGVPLAMLLSSLLIVQVAHADTKKPTIAATDAKQQAALLVEIRKNLSQSGKFSPAVIDGVIAELRNKSMEEIKAMVDFAGSKATGAERLVGPGAGQDARDRAGEIVGRSGSSSATTGNGTQRGVQGQLTGGGINDTRGQDGIWGIGQAGCSACPGDVITEDQPSKQVDQKNGGPINAGNGDVIQRWNDGSASIQRPNGTTEYINSAGRLVDGNGANVTPNPEDNTPGGSGRLTAADVRRIGALLGSKSEPDPNSGKGGAGGGVNATKANPTGTVGLYTEAGTATYVSRADVQEVIRISVEKLQGPQVGK